MDNLENGRANNTMDRALLLTQTVDFINRKKKERAIIEAVYEFARQFNNLSEPMKAILAQENFEIRKQMLSLFVDQLAQHIMIEENPDSTIQQLQEKVQYKKAA